MVSSSDALGPPTFRQKMEEPRPLRIEMDRKGVFSHQSRLFRFIFNNASFLPVRTLSWRLNNYVSTQREGIYKRIECTDRSLLYRCCEHSQYFLKNRLLSFSKNFKKLTFNSVLKNTADFFPFFKYATLSNKRKLPAINRENHEDHPRNTQAQNSNSIRIQEDYNTQVSEKIEGRVTKKLSQEFSRTESRTLRTSSQLDEFLRNPPALVHSGPVPETSRNSNRENPGTNEDRSQNDPHP